MAYKIKNKGLEIKTKDGQNIMGQDYSFQIKEHDAKSRTFIAIASTENPDRSNDIVRADGWDLKNFKKAPRGLWAHDYSALPIFKATSIKVDKETKQLVFQPQFDVYDFANLVYNQYVNGFMSDFSVGFIGKEMQYRDENKPWSGGIEFLKQELLEISAVPVPDNPEAQKLGLSNKNVTSLITLGYASEFQYDELKGIYWNPISKNLEAYELPKIIPISAGIKAVQAKPIFIEKDHEVVGYLFDSSNFGEEKSVHEWIEKNVKVEPKTKYFTFSVSEEDKIELEISEEVTEQKTDDPPEKGKKPEDMPMDNMDDDEDMPMNENDKICDKCSKPKKECECDKEKSFILTIVNEKGEVIRNKTYDEKDGNEVIAKFDKDFENEVDSVSQLQNEVKELKTLLAEIQVKLNAGNAAAEENNNADEETEKEFELDFSEFTPVSPENKDSKEFEIESLDAIKNFNVAEQVVNSDTFTIKFNDIFKQALKENSINLDD